MLGVDLKAARQTTENGKADLEAGLGKIRGFGVQHQEAERRSKKNTKNRNVIKWEVPSWFKFLGNTSR
jgi:hypothetical protein